MSLLARLLAYTILGLLFVRSSDAQRRYDVQPGSSFRIEGTSTVNRFTCRANEIEGYGYSSVSNQLAQVATKQQGAEVRLSIPVLGFDCGQRRMNEDMFNALKANSHPVIEYELESTQLLSAPAYADEPYRLLATGRLTLAGVTKTIEAEVVGLRLAEGVFRIQGQKPLLMTDFGIDPPRALMGLVRAHDRIEVHFDIVAACSVLVAEAKREGLSGWQDYAQLENQNPCPN